MKAKKCLLWVGVAIGLVATAYGVGLAETAYAADRQDAGLRSSLPVSVTMAERYEGMKAAYEAAYKPVDPDGEDEMVLLDSEPWSNADRVAAAAAAMIGTMEKASRDTWQPGYEEFLRGLDFTPEEIRVRVFFVLAQQAVQIGDAMLAALGKPLP